MRPDRLYHHLAQLEKAKARSGLAVACYATCDNGPLF
jgi:hypothetical protein